MDWVHWMIRRKLKNKKSLKNVKIKGPHLASNNFNRDHRRSFGKQFANQSKEIE